MQQFDEDLREEKFQLYSVTTTIIQRVRETYLQLPPDVFLRAGDEVHLATASENGFKEIYSSDRHLLVAARFFNLKGINPLVK